MSSLRDKLRAISPSTPSVKAPQKTDCFRTFEQTPREEYPLPDVLSGALLTALTGQETRDTALEALLFLDTETTGLSGGAGTLAFLTGIGYFENGQFIVEQNLMRDYDEEVFLLSHVADRLKKTALLVTFNGKTFDMPLLESRYTMCRMRQDYVLPKQADLLHIARATWKLRLGRCSLSALEEAIFGVKRTDDLPGALVPKYYFDYLRCHDFALLTPILDHNRQDIKTLPLMLSRLMTLYQNPLLSPYPQDIFSVGRVMEKRGGRELAHRCYRAADKGSMSRLSRLMLADSYRRAKQYQEAAQIYEKMLSDGQGGAFPYIALAKLNEHQFRDFQRALLLTRKAMLLMNPYDDKALKDAQKRALRLMKKIQKGLTNHGNI